jgi:hypothetical protein
MSSESPNDRLAELAKALEEALARSEEAEARLADQQQRLKALGSGREETMRALADARNELRRVGQERDELRKQLARVDGVQTATIALPEDDLSPSMATAGLPSLDDLMVALGNIHAPHDVPDGILLQRVQRERDAQDSEEMISPILVFPEQYAATAGSSAAGKDGVVSRILVLLDPERPIKYPLFKEVMTIGRADIADIQIDNGFLSRLHARIVSTPDSVAIEDIDSKNGIKVNSKLTPHQTLQHGDVVDLGRLRFRYIDTASDDAN